MKTPNKVKYKGATYVKAEKVKSVVDLEKTAEKVQQAMMNDIAKSLKDKRLEAAELLKEIKLIEKAWDRSDYAFFSKSGYIDADSLQELRETLEALGSDLKQYQMPDKSEYL